MSLCVSLESWGRAWLCLAHVVITFSGSHPRAGELLLKPPLVQGQAVKAQSRTQTSPLLFPVWFLALLFGGGIVDRAVPILPSTLHRSLLDLRGLGQREILC